MRRAAVFLLLLAWAGPGAAAKEAASAAPAGLTGRVLVAGAPGEGVEVRLWRLPLSPGPIPLGADDSDGMHPDRGLQPPIPPRPADAVARTDAEGRFAIADAGAGRFLLLATAPGGARGLARAWRESAHVPTEVEIEIADGPCALRGRARWRDGRPFRGFLVVSQVRSRWPDPWRNFEGAFATAPDGSFEIPGLRAELVAIAAVEPGRLRADLGSILLPYDEPVDLVVDEDLAVTEGRLVDPKGRPAGGVDLYLRSEEGGSGWDDAEVVAKIRTAEDGSFRVVGPLAPDFWIVGSDRWLPRPELRGPADPDPVLVARPRPRISGVVRRADGEPVAGVPVLAYQADLWLPPDVVLSGPDGRYSIGLPAEEVRFGPVGRGFVPADRSHDALVVRLGAGEEIERDLLVEPAARITGRVLDEKGRPVAGARVTPGGNPFLETDVAPRLLGLLPGAMTDAEGRYELTRMPIEANQTLSASANGYVTAYGRTTGAAEDVIDIRLERTVEEARRSFRAPEPAPEPDRFLRVLGPDGREVLRGKWQFADGGPHDYLLAGRIAYGLKPGRESPRIRIFDVRDARGRPLPYGPAIVGPFEPGEHTVTLAPGRVVEGRVATPGGRPVRGVSVRVFPMEEDGRAGAYIRFETRSGAEGRFRLTGIDEYESVLDFRVPSTYVEPERVRLAADAETVDIVVTPKVAPRVTVLDPDGAPVPGARVELIAPGEGGPFRDGRVRRETDADGAAAFPLLPPPLFAVLQIEAGGGFRSRTLPGWHPADATVKMERTLTLAGAVLDGAGRPVPDATVFVRAAAGAAPLPDGLSYERIEGGFVLAAITRDDGRFAIEGLPATTIELFAARVYGDAAEHAEVRTPVATAPTDGPEIELRLP